MILSQITGGLLKGKRYPSDAFISGALKPGQDAATIASVKSGHICVDVGANCGYYTMMMSVLSGEVGMVYSIEPVPATFQILNEVVIANRLGNVKTYQLAIGPFSGTATVMFNRPGDLSACVDGIGVYVDGEATQRSGVRMMTLDEFVVREQITKLDFLKIDAQGADLTLLEHGGMDTIKRLRPIILCEALGREKISLIKSFFFNNQYRCDICQGNISQPEFYTVHLIAIPDSV